MFYRIIRRRIRRYRKSVNRKESEKSRGDYVARKELARTFVNLRLEHFVNMYVKYDLNNQVAMKYRKVTIRNQKSRWGSCSSKKNLNFNFRILDLSPELQDYIIVHELCHLKELNHGKTFWDLVEVMIPNAKKFHDEARRMKIS